MIKYFEKYSSIIFQFINHNEKNVTDILCNFFFSFGHWKCCVQCLYFFRKIRWNLDTLLAVRISLKFNYCKIFQIKLMFYRSHSSVVENNALSTFYVAWSHNKMNTFDMMDAFCLSSETILWYATCNIGGTINA